MSTIHFHHSPLVRELRLHNAQQVAADQSDSATSPHVHRMRPVDITPPAPDVSLRRALDRRRRIDLQQSA